MNVIYKDSVVTKLLGIRMDAKSRGREISVVTLNRAEWNELVEHLISHLAPTDNIRYATHSSKFLSPESLECCYHTRIFGLNVKWEKSTHTFKDEEYIVGMRCAMSLLDEL